MKFLFVIFALFLNPVYAGNENNTGAVLLENLSPDIEVFIKDELKTKNATSAILILPIGAHKIELRKGKILLQTVDVQIASNDDFIIKQIKTDLVLPQNESRPEFFKSLYPKKEADEHNDEFVERRQKLLNEYNQQIQQHNVDYQAGVADLKKENFDLRTNTLTLAIKWFDWINGQHSAKHLKPQTATIAISREQLKSMLEESNQKQVFIYFKLDTQPLLQKTSIIDRVILVSLGQEWLIKPISGKLNIAVPIEFKGLTEQWLNSFNKIESVNAQVNLQIFPNEERIAKLTEGSVNFALTFNKIKKPLSISNDFVNNYGYEPTVFPIGKGAIVLYANQENWLFALSSKEIDDVFSVSQGCGGSDINQWDNIQPYLTGIWRNPLKGKFIKLVGLPKSGTFELIAKKLLLCDGRFKTALETKETSEQIFSLLSGNIETLGYANWFDKIASTKQGVKQIAIDGFEPSKENILNEKYPYSYFISFLANKPKDQKLAPLEEEFIKFILSKEGQTILEEAGFIALPLPSDKK
jgi:phosphate transport system substrate-binding protein